MSGKTLTLILTILVLISASLTTARVTSEQSEKEVDQAMDEARSLYQTGRFGAAIAEFQAVIGQLEQVRDLEFRKAQLWDAHFHLGLAYHALNDPLGASEAFKAAIRLDRTRSLDPEVYAPKIIEIFEAARSEVLAEPQMGSPRHALGSSPAPEKESGGSKAPWIVLGVAGAAGGGAIAATSGGGEPTSSVSVTSSDSTSTTDPTQEPEPTAAMDFIGAWTNEDPNTQSITRAETRLGPADLIYVHLWGSCHPTECDWGEQATSLADANDGRLSLVWDQGFAIKNQTLSLEGSDRLRIDTQTHFTDTSGRADYQSTDFFRRVSR